MVVVAGRNSPGAPQVKQGSSHQTSAAEAAAARHPLPFEGGYILRTMPPADYPSPFPQPNEGSWTVAGVTYRDAIVIYRVLTSDAQEARRFLSALKERLKEQLQQEEILIVEREVETLKRLLISRVTDSREPQRAEAVHALSHAHFRKPLLPDAAVP